MYEKDVRIIHWDRAGAVATESFSYLGNPEYLAEYLRRYNHSSPSACGEATTVTTGLGMSEEKVLTIRSSLDVSESIPLVKFLVPNDPDYSSQSDTSYIGTYPRFCAQPLTGRATYVFFIWSFANDWLVLRESHMLPILIVRGKYAITLQLLRLSAKAYYRSVPQVSWCVLFLMRL
jgi:hypothetical protein